MDEGGGRENQRWSRKGGESDEGECIIIFNGYGLGFNLHFLHIKKVHYVSVLMHAISIWKTHCSASSICLYGEAQGMKIMMMMTTMTKSKIFLVMSILLFVDVVHCGTPWEKVFDIKKFGAKADGRTDNAQAIILAFRAACDSRGPARVLIPVGKFIAGEIILEGPCTAKPVTIDIQGSLQAYDDLSLYMNGAWILVERIDGIILTGGGTIDARGMNVWQYHSDDGPQLPVSLVLQTVTNAKLFRLSFLYSMGFHIKVTDSVDVNINHLRIRAPRKSPNTDGIHLSNATNVQITDMKIGTGDDCISIGHGTNNILVSRIICGPGHGISIGSLGKRSNEMNVKGITVTSCTFRSTANGARIKTYPNSPVLTASNIIFQDLVMDKVRNPIIIDQHYGTKSKSQSSNVKLSDIHFRNIRGTTISPKTITLDCSASYPCQGVELANINLWPFGPLSPLKSPCSNARVITRGYINPSPCSVNVL